MDAQSRYSSIAVWVFFWSLVVPRQWNGAIATAEANRRHLATNGYNDGERILLNDGSPQNLDFRRCDESKCLSSGVEAIVNRTEQIGGAFPISDEDNEDNNDEYALNRFDCWYRPQDNETMLCAEGYTGIPIDAEPPKLFSSPNFRPDVPVEQRYYTCCPAVAAAVVASEQEGSRDAADASQLVRRCGDPKKIIRGSDVIAASSNETITATATATASTDDPTTMMCDPNDADGRILPRPIKKSMPFYPDTYVCCDQELVENEEDGISSAAVAPSLSEADGVCDESRCIARAIGEFMPGFGCWAEGPGQLHPYSCSDGYIGVPVNEQADQPPLFDERQELFYYTCCPPSVASTLAAASKSENIKPATTPVVPRRHCSDPIVYQPGSNNETTNLVCDDPLLQYPRKQNKNGHFILMIRGIDVTTETYVCCDTELEEVRPPHPEMVNASVDALSASSDGTARSYLDQVDCVFACDPDFFFDCIAENKYGLLWPMGCDDPNGIFVEPKVLGQGYLGGEGSLFFYKYGCCKKGYGNGPFIQDAAFQKTVWPQLVLSAISLVTSVTLVVALLLSFCYGNDVDAVVTRLGPFGKRSRQSTSRTSTNESSSRNYSNRSSVTFSGEIAGPRSNGRPRRRSIRKNIREVSNSSYNTYLVYLAVPDIVLNLWVVCMYGGYVNQVFHPAISSYIVNSMFYERKTAVDMAVILGCSAANLYLNAIISYQLFALLKNSRKRLRTAPPTSRRVGVQAVVVYALALCISLLRFFLADVDGIPVWVKVTLYFVASAGIPMLYLLYVCIVIWREKLLPSMRGPLRILALYFSRIMAVFVVLWFPGVMLLSLACNWKWDDTVAGETDINVVLYTIGLYFCSIQPILSAGVALTKPDVRAAVVRLFRFSYFRRESGDVDQYPSSPFGASRDVSSKEMKTNHPDSTNFAGINDASPQASEEGGDASEPFGLGEVDESSNEDEEICTASSTSPDPRFRP